MVVVVCVFVFGLYGMYVFLQLSLTRPQHWIVSYTYTTPKPQDDGLLVGEKVLKKVKDESGNVKEVSLGFVGEPKRVDTQVSKA